MHIAAHLDAMPRQFPKPFQTLRIFLPLPVRDQTVWQFVALVVWGCDYLLLTLPHQAIVEFALQHRAIKVGRRDVRVVMGNPDAL